MKIIKKNINLLEYPLWTPSSNKATLKEYSVGNKYIISTKNGLPTSKDIDILNMLIYFSQLRKSNTFSFDSYYNIIKGMGYSCSGIIYNMLEESLNRWVDTNITFIDSFFINGKKKSYSKINIIDSIKIKKHNSINIKIGSEFYNLNQDKYSKVIYLDKIKALSPTSKRLFEILIKNFYKRIEWKIVNVKLFEKMITDEIRIKKMEKIVEEINLLNKKIKLEISKTNNIFYFNKNKILI